MANKDTIRLTSAQKIRMLRKALYDLMIDSIGNDLFPKKPKTATIRNAQKIWKKTK